MLSALVVALDASQVQVPVLVAASPLSSIEQSLEILGYTVACPRHTEMAVSTQDFSAGESPVVSHFESQTLANVGSKHAFFYLDGLIRLFGSKLWKFSRGSSELSILRVFKFLLL